MSNRRTVPTATTPDVCTFTILSEGQEVPRTYHVMGITVWKEINRIPKATLIFRDGDAPAETFPISDTEEFVPGRKIEIKVGYRGTEDTVFKGVVVRHSIKIRKDTSFLYVDCYDEAVKMTVARKSAYFNDRSDSDVIEDLLVANQLAADITTTREVRESVVQFETTDWDFLLERAAASGLLVLAEAGKVAAKAPDFSQQPVADVVFGSSLLELDLEIDARLQPTTLTAAAWEPAEQVLSKAEAQPPRLNLNGNLAGEAVAEALKVPLELRSSYQLTDLSLQKKADDELLKARLSNVRGRVRCQGNVAIRPGSLLNLSGVGTRFAGKAYVTGIRHQIANGNWETDAQLGYPEEPIIPKVRPVTTTGLHVAVVTQLKDDPQGEDRVRIRMPTIADRGEGVWARVAAPDAGKERGLFFRPQIGDEVVVGFMQQDATHPVVLGMCNSSHNPAPLEAKDANDEKGYVSRSKMKLLFNDDKNTLTLETPAGNRLLLSEEEEGIFLKDQHGNKISINSEGIKIESTQDVNLTAAQNMKLEGKQIAAQASTGFKADGGGGCELSAGNGMTTVKGATVMIN